MSEDTELREVYRAADSQEAERLRETLESEGIEARVVEDLLQGTLGCVRPIAAPRLWVHAKDFERARRIVEEQLQRVRGGTPPGNQWTCPQCGEQNEATFDLCWSCQAERKPASKVEDTPSA